VFPERRRHVAAADRKTCQEKISVRTDDIGDRFKLPERLTAADPRRIIASAGR